MTTFSLLLGLVAASLLFAAYTSWRSGNERRDVYLMLAIGIGFSTASGVMAL